MLTFNQVCAALGIVDHLTMAPGERAAIMAGISAYSQALRLYTGRRLSLATWQDTFVGSEQIVLGEYPVTGISEITVDGIIIDPASYLVDQKSGTLYYLRDGFYYTSFMSTLSYSYGWGTWRNRVTQVTYTAGYNPLPDDLAMLICDFALDRLRLHRLNRYDSFGLSGNVKTVQIDGVGTVTMAEQSGGVNQGFSRSSAALGGPILGAGVAIADLYRDLKKFVSPSDHRLMTNEVEETP